MTGHARRLLMLVQFLVAASLSGLIITNRLTTEAKGAMAVSDHAFDLGELKRAMVEARYASYAAIPSSPYRKQSTERLEAIAEGSEATGRSKTALLAWSGLLATANDALGAPWRQVAIEQQPEQHVSYLLDKVSGGPASGTRGESSLPALTRCWSPQGAIAATLIWLAPLLGTLGLALRFGTLTRDCYISKMAVVRSYGMYLAAACCWCIGWVIA